MHRISASARHAAVLVTCRALGAGGATLLTAAPAVGAPTASTASDLRSTIRVAQSAARDLLAAPKVPTDILKSLRADIGYPCPRTALAKCASPDIPGRFSVGR